VYLTSAGDVNAELATQLPAYVVSTVT